jgi:hypothetical protein
MSSVPLQANESATEQMTAITATATDPVAPTPTKVRKQWYSTIAYAKAMKRRRRLEADMWTVDVTPTSVTCMACNNTIQLDKSRAYYPENWETHLGRCLS